MISWKPSPDNREKQVELFKNSKLVKAQSGTTSQGQRFPLTGTIDQIGSDIERIKQIGVDHIVFGYNFIPTGRDLDNMLDITKQLARLAR